MEIPWTESARASGRLGQRGETVRGLLAINADKGRCAPPERDLSAL